MNRQLPERFGIQEQCRSQLASIVSEGLDCFPPCVFDLDILLNAPVVDLKKVSGAVSSDDGFSRRVLHLSSAILGPSDAAARTIADAAVLLGPCLFHTVVLLCAVTEFGPRSHRDRNAESLWSHSVQMAILCEKIAQETEYPVRGAAYVAGLLHDIGSMPLLTVAREQEKAFPVLAGIDWRDKIDLEREIFGLDHCQVGLWMAKSWKFSPSLIDAVFHHHDPSKAEKDAHLAEIVGAAEYHCTQLVPQQARQRAQYA